MLLFCLFFSFFRSKCNFVCRKCEYKWLCLALTFEPWSIDIVVKLIYVLEKWTKI